MIEIKNLHKAFGQNQVLKGVDITVNKGDVVVVIGPSGSGKTTRNNVFVLVSPMEYAASYCPFPTERRAPRTVSVICTTA